MKVLSISILSVTHGSKELEVNRGKEKEKEVKSQIDSSGQSEQTTFLRFLLYGSSSSKKKSINDIIFKSTAEKRLYFKLQT